MPTILLRRGTSTQWAAKNPVLGAGELGVDLSQGKMKLGDGVTAWNSLSFVTSGGGGGGGGNSWGSITGVLSSQADLQLVLDDKEDIIAAGTTSQYFRGDKTWQTLNKAAVGLGSVDNTTDANKPVSTATQTALNNKQNILVSGTNIKTINGTTLLGSGDISISSGSGFVDGGVSSSIYDGININGGNA
jgi:hypothetical protein